MARSTPVVLNADRQAQSIRDGMATAEEGMRGLIGEALLKQWVKTPVAHGFNPVSALHRAAHIAECYAHGHKDHAAAVQVGDTLKLARKQLALAVVGKQVSDTVLSENPDVPRPAKAFAEVLALATEVMSGISASTKKSSRGSRAEVASHP